MPNRLLNAKEQDRVTLELKEDEYLLDKFLEAQDAKTLIAVGAELERIMRSGETVEEDFVEALKRGEMPE